MPKTTIDFGRYTVEIEEIESIGKAPGKRLRATVGETTVEVALTFAAEDGPRPEVTVEQLQADLDAARQRLAAEAVWREQLREGIGNLK